MASLEWHKWTIPESFLSENRIFHQFAKVFSLESFSLLQLACSYAYQFSRLRSSLPPDFDHLQIKNWKWERPENEATLQEALGGPFCAQLFTTMFSFTANGWDCWELDVNLQPQGQVCSEDGANEGGATWRRASPSAEGGVQEHRDRRNGLRRVQYCECVWNSFVQLHTAELNLNLNKSA